MSRFFAACVASTELPTTREGGGLIQVPAANAPLIFAAPTDLSFGLLDVGASATRTVALSDAGGGAGTWAASVSLQGAASGNDPCNESIAFAPEASSKASNSCACPSSLSR